MSETTPNVIHILVVGFHHQKGATVEFCHPPLSTRRKRSVEPVTESITNLLPTEWRCLPYLALPDGCHNYEEDSVYFTLPQLLDAPDAEVSGISELSASHVRYSVVYGVACCRQLDAKDVLSSSEELIRSTVQKSVCILSRVPMFGFIEAKLNLITHAYFNSKDFSDVSILKDAYDHLNATLTATLPSEALNIGLSQQDLVGQYHHRLLQVFKALLLQKRVVVYGQQAKVVCNAVLSIVSLFTGTLSSFLNHGKSERDGYGFPLAIFTESSLSIQPYVCLQQMDMLMDKLSPCVIAGVVNPLYEKQKEKICDIFVDLIDGHVSVGNPTLKSQLHLSAADLRFCSVLSKSIQRSPSISSQVETENPTLQYSDWLGSNDWVLAQFKLYLLSLLATSASVHTQSMDDFGPEFMIAWLKSSTFTKWFKLRSTYKQMDKIEAKHVCEGSLSLGDLKRRLVAQASDYGLNIQSREQVTHAVQQTQKALSSAVSGLWSGASSAMYHWWSSDNTSKDTNHSRYS